MFLAGVLLFLGLDVLRCALPSSVTFSFRGSNSSAVRPGFRNMFEGFRGDEFDGWSAVPWHCFRFVGFKFLIVSAACVCLLVMCSLPAAFLANLASSLCSLWFTWSIFTIPPVLGSSLRSRWCVSQSFGCSGSFAASLLRSLDFLFRAVRVLMTLRVLPFVGVAVASFVRAERSSFLLGGLGGMRLLMFFCGFGFFRVLLLVVD